MNPALKPFFKQINFLFVVLFMGLVTFAVAAYAASVVLTQKELPDFTWLIYGAPISGMALLILAQRLYLKKIADTIKIPALHQRIEGFRNAAIIRLLILDLAGVLNLGVFAVTGNLLFLGLGGIIMLLFILNKPSLERMARDLKLEGMERDMIFDENPPETDSVKAKGKQKK